VLLAATFGVLLLLPVASSIAPPVRITVRTEAQRRAELPSLPGAIEVVLARTLPDTHAAVTPAMPWSSRPSLTALLLAGWLVGVTLSLTPVIVL
jgi:hypothetical protein